MSFYLYVFNEFLCLIIVYIRRSNSALAVSGREVLAELSPTSLSVEPVRLLSSAYKGRLTDKQACPLTLPVW